MTEPPDEPSHGDFKALDSLDEPVQRYLRHALVAGVAPSGAVLAMAGRIKVVRWLHFSAEQRFCDHAFEWRARAGWGSLKPLHVVDWYRNGRGRTEGRLFGRIRFLHADDENTARAAAGRAAAESIWVPGTLVPQRGARWRAEADDEITAEIAVPPERVELTLRIDASGAVRELRLMRWGNVGQKHFGYIPFGGTVTAERRFGAVVLPSELAVGWWYGTPRYAPFFQATILDASSPTERHRLDV